MKTFRQVLAENDKEFSYEVRSPANIHHPEMLRMIRLAFAPYRVKEVTAGAYKTPSASNEEFPSKPNTPVYSSKVITGLPVPTQNANPVQLVAFYTRIHADHLKVLHDGKDIREPAKTDTGEYTAMTSTDPNHRGSVDPKEDKSAQNKVGTARIGEFLKTLRGSAKERESKKFEREIYENFSVTHLGIESLVGKPLRSGYYIIEATDSGLSQKLTVEGPFGYCPDNIPYRDSVVGVKKIGLEETNQGDRARYVMNVSGFRFSGQDYATVAEGHRRHEVQIGEQGSTKIFKTVVTALDESQAAKIAMDQISTQYHLAQSSLFIIPSVDPRGRIINRQV